MSSHLSTGWTGDWRTLSFEEMLSRAEMLEKYYENLPEGVTSEAWAEAQLIRMELRKKVTFNNVVPVTGIWLRGGENKMEVLAEVEGVWLVVIDEFVPLQGNDGSVWPISHIVETSGIVNGKRNE